MKEILTVRTWQARMECGVCRAVKQSKRRAARKFRNNSGLMTWIGRAKATNRKKTVIRRWRRTNYQEKKGIYGDLLDGQENKPERLSKRHRSLCSLHRQGEEEPKKKKRSCRARSFPSGIGYGPRRYVYPNQPTCFRK